MIERDGLGSIGETGLRAQGRVGEAERSAVEGRMRLVSDGEEGVVGLTVREARGLEGVRSWEPAWASLYERAREASVCMSPAWSAAWAAQHGDAVRLVGAWEGDALVALLPLVERRWLGARVWAPLASGIPGELGLLCESGRVEGACELAAWANDAGASRLWVNGDVSSRDVGTLAFVGRLADLGWRVREVERAIVRTCECEESLEAFLVKHRSGKSRSTIRRKRNRLRRAHGWEFEWHVGAACTEAVIDRIVAVQRASWMRRRGAAVLGEPFYRRLVRELAGSGELRIAVLRVGGEDAAFVCGALHGRRLEYIWPAFRLGMREWSVGACLLSVLVNRSRELGFDEIDFGHGDGDYKQEWGTRAHGIRRVAAGRGARGAAGCVAMSLVWGLARHPGVRGALRTAKRVAARERARAA